MPISRRGLTAAGLALATVSALGVTSTLNASAEQVPPIQPAAEVPGTETSDAVPPPPPPPPPPVEKAESGPAAKGVSGRSIGGSGRKAKIPKMPEKPVEGPSLRTRSSGSFSALAAPGTGGPRYFHAVATQNVAADGTRAYITVAEPTLAVGESHTLAEIFASNAPVGPNGEVDDAIEVGWRVGPRNPETPDTPEPPRLFVYHWVNGVAQGWENPGYQPRTEFKKHETPWKVGDPLPAGSDPKQFNILLVGDAWWVGYDNVWFGHFPVSLFHKPGETEFRKLNSIMWYGEVTTPKAVPVPCSQMGTGVKPVKGKTAKAAWIHSIQLVTNEETDTVYGSPESNIEIRSTSPYYSAFQSVPSKDQFRFGGPGASDEARKAAGLPPC